MLQALVHFSLKFRRRGGGAGVRAAGLRDLRRQQRQAGRLPELRPAAGGDPDRVPRPGAGAGRTAGHAALETMVNGLGDMESLRSESIEGLSIITVVFKEGTDVFRARQMLAETAGRDGRQTARQRQGAAHDAADLLDHGPAQDRPGLGQADADGAAHLRRLDAQAAAALGAGRGQVQHLRRRGAATADPGPAGPAGGLRPGAVRRAGRGARLDRRDGRGLRREPQPAHHASDRRPGADAGDARRGGRRAHQRA